MAYVDTKLDLGTLDLEGMDFATPGIDIRVSDVVDWQASSIRRGLPNDHFFLVITAVETAASTVPAYFSFSFNSGDASDNNSLAAAAPLWRYGTLDTADILSLGMPTSAIVAGVTLFTAAIMRDTKRMTASRYAALVVQRVSPLGVISVTAGKVRAYLTVTPPVGGVTPAASWTSA